MKTNIIFSVLFIFIQLYTSLKVGIQYKGYSDFSYIEGDGDCIELDGQIERIEMETPDIRTEFYELSDCVGKLLSRNNDDAQFNPPIKPKSVMISNRFEQNEPKKIEMSHPPPKQLQRKEGFFNKLLKQLFIRDPETKSTKRRIFNKQKPKRLTSEQAFKQLNKFLKSQNNK